MSKNFKSLIFGLFVAWLPALVCAENFFSGVGGSFLLLIIVVFVTQIGYFLKNKLKTPRRMLIYILMLFMQLIIVGTIFNLSHNTEIQNFGLYLSILMANIVVLGHVELIKDEKKGLNYTLITMSTCLLFASFWSLLREVVGFGTITYWFDGSFVRVFDQKYAIKFFGEISGGLVLGVTLWLIAILIMFLTDKRPKKTRKEKLS